MLMPMLILCYAEISMLSQLCPCCAHVFATRYNAMLYYAMLCNTILCYADAHVDADVDANATLCFDKMQIKDK